MWTADQATDGVTDAIAVKTPGRQREKLANGAVAFALKTEMFIIHGGSDWLAMKTSLAAFFLQGA